MKIKEQTRKLATNRGWDKKILTLGILYYPFLKSIDETKKRTRQNSECQKTSFVRFLYLKLDSCPELLQIRLIRSAQNTVLGCR